MLMEYNDSTDETEYDFNSIQIKSINVHAMKKKGEFTRKNAVGRRELIQ